MKAIRIHRHGGPEVLQIDDVPQTRPGQGEVLVRTRATALNHMDLWVRRGIPGIGSLPLTLGSDLAGVVEEAGEGAGELTPGDRVVLMPMFTCGKCRDCREGRENLCLELNIPGEHVNGTHAEFFAAPSDSFLKLPDHVGFAEAAAFPLASLTAWRMVAENGGAGPGMTVLVIAAGSGVGSAAVQIAKHLGARVIATVGGKEKLHAARGLGADEVIDHRNDKISRRVKELTGGKGADLIIEHVGEKVWTECLKSLAHGGKLVTCGATTGPIVTVDLRHLFIKQQRLIGSTMGTRRDLENVLGLVASGRFRPAVAKTFPYAEAIAAHEYLESSHCFGKVVLEWGR